MFNHWQSSFVNQLGHLKFKRDLKLRKLEILKWDKIFFGSCWPLETVSCQVCKLLSEYSGHFSDVILELYLENCEPKVGNELNNLKETNYNSYLAIQKFTMDFEDERLGAESFCTLLIASLDDEISNCCEFKGLGKLKIFLIPWVMDFTR